MDGSRRDVEMNLESEKNTEPPTNISFHKIVRSLLLVRNWLVHTRKKMQKNTVGDDNIRKVFEPLSATASTTDLVKESPLRKSWNWSFDETGLFFYVWTFFVFIGCCYNLVMIIVMVFEEVHKAFYHQWIILNIFFDTVFFMDLVLLTRKEFIEDGVKTTGVKKMLFHRIKTQQFIFDVLCIIPFDILLIFQPQFSFSRLNRLLKCYRIGEFNTLTEIRTNFPNMFRLTKLIFTCFIIFHWNGCLYFLIGVLYDFPSATYDDWIFSYDKIPSPVVVTCNIFDDRSPDYCSSSIVPSLRIFSEYDNMTEEVDNAMLYWRNRSRQLAFSKFTKQYGLSFYWSALTLVTLGEQPWPNNTFQNSFEIGDTLLGLVIFAVIVGDVGNMVSTMNLNKSEFEEILDGCKSYMVYRKVHHYLERKAVDYFSYMWSHGGMKVDEKEIAAFLPPRLYGQLAVHIHMNTLRRVKLFEECELNLLYELILKLELRMYSPMDYVCRKGEVGTEMYIVKTGFVEVVSEDGKKVFVRLGEGTVFGELSILNIPGNKNGNRRTANVRCVGYSDMYVLSKEDLWAALREYPDAKDSLMKKGKDILAKDNLLEHVHEDEDLDPDAPVGEHLQLIAKNVKEIEQTLGNIEEKIRKSGNTAKRRIYMLETDLNNKLNKISRQLKDSGRQKHIDDKDSVFCKPTSTRKDAYKASNY